MRRAVLLTAAAVLLAGPTVLAFFSGGFFDGPRFVATLTAWVLVLVVALAAPRPLPGSAPGRFALAGLALIAAWSAASLAWAPLSEPATDNVVRLIMYLGAFLAAVGLLRERAAARAVEPALAFGTVIVIGYGLAGRLLPELVELNQSIRALGRLEQPITYWNAEGALAAMGFVLCARLAGTEARPVAIRVVAAAAAAPLGLGVYLSYSRGAIAAALVGLVVLLAAAPTRPQLRSAVTVFAAGLVATVCGGVFAGVATLEGTASERQDDGVVVLGLLALVMLAAGWVQHRAARAERGAGAAVGRLGFAHRLPAVAAGALALCFAGLVAAGLAEQGETGEQSARRTGEQSARQGVSRLTSADSPRYDYWRVGARAFAEQPLEGVGSGGFRVEWVRERPVREAALEVHSLPLEIAAELGIPGLLGLAMLVGGVAVAGRRALHRHPELAPGACAALVVWSLHVSIDWGWQIPALSLLAVVLAGALVAASETGPAATSPRAGSGA
jgi:O-Antigen ligase